MVTVTMVGILSAIGTMGVSRYFYSARVGDAKAAVSAIKIAQEMYKAEYGVYANVSGDDRDSGWYPGEPGKFIYPWVKEDHDLFVGENGRPGWSDLDVPLTEFHGGGCTTDAGFAGENPTATHSIAGSSFAADDTPQTDWYVVVCATDVDGDGDDAKFGGSSLFSEVIVEDPSEH